MTKALFLLAATCLSVSAAVPVISSAAADKVTHGSVRILATSTAGSTNWYIRYSTSDPPTDATRTEKRFAADFGPVTNIGHGVTGLDPATTYYFQICGTIDGGGSYGCSSTVTQATAALPADRFARPAQPAVTAIAAYPAAWDRVYTIISTSNCNGTAVVSTGANTFTGGMQESIDHALANGSGSLGEHLVIDPPYTCKPSGTRGYRIGARTGGGTGEITIGPATIAVPEGARMTSGTGLPTVSATYSNGAQGGAFELLNAATKVRLVGMQITGDVFASAYKTVTNVSGGNITIPSHGRSVGQPIQFWSDAGGSIKNAKVATVADANTLTVSAGTSTSGTLAAGWKMAYSATEIYCLVCVPDGLTTNPSNIIIDRVYFKGAGFPMGHYLGVRARGDDWFIVGTSFVDLDTWGGFSPTVVTTYGSYTSAYATTGGTGMALTPLTVPTSIDPGGLTRRLTVENNFFNTPGITFFAAGGGGTVLPTDHVIKRNKFEWHNRAKGDHPDWDGFHHVYRQHLEYKTISKLLITGNDFGNMYNMSETGTFSQPIVLTPRTADGNVASTVNVIKDVTIEYNTAHDCPGFVNIVGLDHDGWAPQVEPTKRVWITNNLGYRINGWTTGWSTSPRVYGGGMIFHVSRVEDVSVVHNTFPNNHGSFAGVWYYAGQPATGLDMRNNIFGYNTSTYGVMWDANTAIPVPAPVTTGSQANHLKKAFTSAIGANARYVIKNNLFIPGMDSVDSTSGTNESVSGISQATCQTDWDFGTDPTNKCATGSTLAERLNYPVFLSRSSAPYNFRLRYDSPAKKRAASRLSDDGTDLGADIGAVLAAQGKLEFRPKVLAGAGLLRYYAPTTSDACRVKLDGGTPTSDGAGARARSTAVSLSGVSTVTLYCGVEVYSCPANGGTCTPQ